MALAAEPDNPPIVHVWLFPNPIVSIRETNVVETFDVYVSPLLMVRVVPAERFVAAPVPDHTTPVALMVIESTVTFELSGSTAFLFAVLKIAALLDVGADPPDQFEPTVHVPPVEPIHVTF